LLNTADVIARPELNFLNADAREHANERIDAVRHAGGTLEPARLRHNMLSSMPACFNLFGALWGQPQFLELVQATLDPHATAILRVDGEWAPPPNKALNDKTAFDAVVTQRTDGSTHLIGVETKYTEPFSTTAYPADKYRATHDGCGWFRPDTADGLTVAAKNQLWRNVLLAARCELNSVATSASVAVVTLDDDAKAQRAMDGDCATLHEPQLRCQSVPFQRFVEVARHLGGAIGDWANQFEQRYLNLGPILDADPAVYHERNGSRPCSGA